MSSAFASRLAQLKLIGRPTPNRHQQGSTNDDSWYTPYTGPYEPPPAITYSPPQPLPLAQEHQPYSAAYPHPYSYQIARRTYHEDQPTEREQNQDPNPTYPSSLPPYSHPTESNRHGTGHASKFRTAPGPSSLSTAGGIGESPVAPYAQVAKAERASHRSSLASFMTFGGRRASHTPQTHHPPLTLALPQHPASAQPVLSRFPETRLPSPDQYRPSTLPRGSAPASGHHTPPLTRKRTQTHSGFHTTPPSTSFRARAHSQVDESPQSFFDTSVLTKPNSPTPEPAPTPAPTPVERGPPMGVFTHPFATAYPGPRYAPPVRPNSKSMRQTRSIATSPGGSERDRDRKGKGKQRAIPDLGQGLEIQAPAPSVQHAIKTSVSTPNLREAFHHVSPVERDEEVHRHQHPRQQQRQQRSEKGRPSTGTTATTSGGGEGRVAERVLAGQTLCDTFFFPRPRLQAHPITPPLTPETNPQQIWSSPQPSLGPPRPTVRPRANSLRWLRRPSAPELRPPLPHRPDSRTEAERVIAEGERLNRLREQWREFADRGLGSGRERERSRSRSRSRSRKSSLRSTVKDGSKEVGGREGPRVRAKAKSLRGKFSVEFFKPRSNLHSHSNSNPQSRAHTSSGGTYTTTTGSGGTGGTHSRGPSSGGDVHHSHNPNLHHVRKVDHGHHGHLRKGSLGQTAIRRAQTVCVGDLGNVSPGVEKVLDPTTHPRHAREASDARKALAMVSPEVRAAAAAIPVPLRSHSLSGSTGKSTGIGLAISVPPATQSVASTSGSAKYAGPHTSHQTTTNLVNRHRLPPRASVQMAQTVSPVNLGLEPPRESWTIYGAATEEDLMRSELHVVKEDSEKRSVHKTPEQQQQPQPPHEGIVTLTDAFRRRSVDSGLGSEEVHQSQNEHLEDMTFAAGGTLQRLLSSASVSLRKQARATATTNASSVAATISSVGASRPVSSVPSRTGFLILEDEEAEVEGAEEAEEAEARPSLQDSMPALSPLLSTTPDIQSPASGSGSYSKPPPPLTLASFAEPDPDKSPVRTPASRASHRRVPSEAKSERSWGRVYASENIGGPRSGMSSLESSPKMSPRPLGGVDDLEGYKDLFYRPSCFPKNNSPPNKSNTNLALLIPENNKPISNNNNNSGGGAGGSGSGSGSGFGKRPELLTFDSARSGNSSASISGRSLSAISAEVEVQRTRLEELEREHSKRWGHIMRSINGGGSPVPLEPFDPSEDTEGAEGAPSYTEGDRPEGSDEGSGKYW